MAAIDATRFDAFWQNPELYRLKYEVRHSSDAKYGGLSIKTKPYGMSRGTAFHMIAEGVRGGQSEQEINGRLVTEGIDTKASKVAWALWHEYERQFPEAQYPTVATEIEFDFAIPGSHHRMVGRIDRIYEREGLLYVGDFKTSNGKRSFDYTSDDWKHKRQADFYILGARSLGYQVQGMYVYVVNETTPPKIWEIPVARSEHQLKVTQLAVHQTIETIEMYRATFGTDLPWPHVSNSYPCSMPGRCEYEGVCQQDARLYTALDVASFKPREEHLELLK